jgi:hypothetical protein
MLDVKLLGGARLGVAASCPSPYVPTYDGRCVKLVSTAGHLGIYALLYVAANGDPVGEQLPDCTAPGAWGAFARYNGKCQSWSEITYVPVVAAPPPAEAPPPGAEAPPPVVVVQPPPGAESPPYVPPPPFVPPPITTQPPAARSSNAWLIGGAVALLGIGSSAVLLRRRK